MGGARLWRMCPGEGDGPLMALDELSADLSGLAFRRSPAPKAISTGDNRWSPDRTRWTRKRVEGVCQIQRAAGAWMSIAGRRRVDEPRTK